MALVAKFPKQNNSACVRRHFGDRFSSFSILAAQCAASGKLSKGFWFVR
jgi:hypothetical protein